MFRLVFAVGDVLEALPTCHASNRNRTSPKSVWASGAIIMSQDPMKEELWYHLVFLSNSPQTYYSQYLPNVALLSILMASALSSRP